MLIAVVVLGVLVVIETIIIVRLTKNVTFLRERLHKQVRLNIELKNNTKADIERIIKKSKQRSVTTMPIEMTEVK